MLMERIERLIHERPGLTARALAQALFGPDGYAERVTTECRLLAQLGRIARRGEGGPSDPFTYHPAE